MFDLELKQVRTTAHIIDAVEKLIKNFLKDDLGDYNDTNHFEYE